MKQAGCHLCNCNEYTIFKGIDSYQLFKCKQCGLVYLPLSSVRQEIEKEYTAKYHTNILCKKELETEEEIEEEINKNIGRAKEIVTQFGKRGKLLDIGCGAGFFLARLKRYGWDVTGIDISEWAGKFARDKLGLKVFTGNVEDIQFNDKFDVITMYHNLEHLPEPIKTLEKVSNILTNGGTLIIKGPNLNSFDRKWHGADWRGYQIPFHLYHFTPETYKMVLEKSGFSVQNIFFQYWNPMAHLLEITLGDGIRADHPPDAVADIRKKKIYNNYIFAILAKIMRITARVCGLKGRDLAIYARKKTP